MRYKFPSGDSNPAKRDDVKAKIGAKSSVNMKRYFAENPNAKNNVKFFRKDGKDHWNWKGGVSPIREKIRKMPEYKLWRTAVFERDDYACQICGKRGVRLEVDHYPKKYSHVLDDNKLTSLKEARACEELWDISNGRTLCYSCHRVTVKTGVRIASRNEVDLWSEIQVVGGLKIVAGYREPQNPGLGGLDELTTAEELFIQNLAGLTYAQGDILYHDGSNLINLGPGTSGRFLKTQGPGNDPIWAAIAGGGDLLADGSVPLTANWDVGAFTITALTFVSDQATGTAPFTVASTTVVTNLNADTVDGIEASAFLQNISEDTTPTLGGDLDAGNFDITNLTDITADGVITLGAASLIYPALDGNAGEVLTTDGGANLSFATVTAGTADSVNMNVRKSAAGTIVKGTPVYFVSWNPSGFAEVEAADADDVAKMPAIGVTSVDTTNSATVDLFLSGTVTGLNMSAFSDGDELYVSDDPATTRGLTATKPANKDDAIQKIGIVMRNHASQGVMQIIGAGRSNDIPNVVEPRADTATGDNAALGYTATEGLVLTGQGSSTDVAIKNDADATVLSIPTGTTNVTVVGVVTAAGFTIGSAAITEAELEILDGATVTTTELNIIDGGTSATATTLADADRVVVNDAGVMKQVALTDFETYFEVAIDTLANLTSIQGLTVTLADAGVDAILGWDDTASAYENLSQAEVLAIIGDAGAAAKGVVELATITETNTGTDTGRAVTPDGLSGAKRTIMLTAAGGQGLTTAGAAGPTQVEAATNDINYWVLEFDTTTEEHAFWAFPMPENWDGGVVNAQFYWTNAGGSSSQTVAWGIAGGSWGDSDAIDAALGTEVTTTDTWLAQGDIHISPESGDITIANAAAGEWVNIVVARKVASDNLTGDARLLSVKLEYTIDQYSDSI